MPVIRCPQCRGSLRFPDGMPPRKVQCPHCERVFRSDAGADGTAEAVALPPAAPPPPVAPPPPARPAPATARIPPAPAPRTTRIESPPAPTAPVRRPAPPAPVAVARPAPRPRPEPAFEIIEEPERIDSRWDKPEDEYADWDEVPDRRPADEAGRFRAAATGMLLTQIGFWCLTAGSGVGLLYVLLLFVGIPAELHELFNVLRGLPALAAFGLFTVAAGFLCTGPPGRGALGFAVASAAAVGLLDLIFLATLGQADVRGRLVASETTGYFAAMGLAALALWSCLSGHMWSLGKQLRKRHLAERGRTLAIAYPCGVLAIASVTAAVRVTVRTSSPDIAFGVGMLNMILINGLGMAAFIVSAVLAQELGPACARHARTLGRSRA